MGNLLRAQFTQLVSTPTSNHQTSYVLKVIDAFGQYDEDTTTVNVVDTTPPTVTRRPTRRPVGTAVECTGRVVTPVAIGTATADDVCDASPAVTNDAPQLFRARDTMVTWTATGTQSTTTNKGYGDAESNRSRTPRRPTSP